MSFFVIFASTVTIIVHGFPSTLDGPLNPVTAPLDPNLNPIAFDLPESDPSFVKPISEFLLPEQISVSLSYSFDSVWISWVTGLYLSLQLSLPFGKNNFFYYKSLEILLNSQNWTYLCLQKCGMCD